jgi:signal transduction histidine kinase
MRGTDGRETATKGRESSGTAPMAKQPISWSMTANTGPKRPSEFECALLAIAGHDLRQPLQVIQGTHELLGLGARTESELRLLRCGQNAIDQLRTLLDQLVAALRLHEHAKEVQLTPVPVGPLLREACRENEITALQKGVSVRMVQTTATILSNSLLLSSILRNLVNNAVKFTPPGGRILLGCRHVNQSIRIDVYDTGIGVPGDEMPRIFQAFTRLDPVRRDGLGIGLFIVRQAVGLLGHRVDINYTPSQGSQFSIFAKRAGKV